MSYKLLYKGEFRNIEATADALNAALNTLVTVNIYDTASGEGDVEMTIPLEMAERPVVSMTSDEDEDKFTVVKPKALEINIHSTSSIGIETFIDGSDRRFYVEVFVTPDGGSPRLKFNGWLSVADISEDFMPDPNTIPLTATDGLAMMEDETLVNLDDEIPEYEWPVMDYLVWALTKGTGIEREVVVVFNTREEDAPAYDDDADGSGHFLKWIYLDAKTFEVDVHEMDTCKTVIEKILGNKCFITTYDGKIWIQSVDEMLFGDPYYMYRFLSDGTFFSKSTINLRKYIGVSSPMQWMNDDCLVSSSRAIGKLELTFNYNYAKEIVCNIDMDRGTGDEPTNAASEDIEYVPECIDFLREGSSGPDPEDIDFQPSVGAKGVIVKTYEYGYEKNRYLSALTAGGFRHYFRFSEIYVNQKDKISLSFDYKFNVDDGTTNVFPCVVRLIADDGTIWAWEYDSATGDSSWQEMASTDGWFDFTWRDDVSGLDNTEWRSMSATSPAFPATGRLSIRLVNGFAAPKEVHFINLQIEYIGLVNGSYQKYNKQVHRVEQQGNGKATREDEVFISDAPNRRIKGALLKRGADIAILSASMDFDGTFNKIETSGDVRNKIVVGKKYQVSGTVNNNIVVTVTALNYSLIGNITQIFLAETLTEESGVSATLSLIQYVLSERFYRGHLFPAGTSDDNELKPFGEIQSFDVWNQYNRTMRTFEGTVDHLQTENEDADGGIPDLPFVFLLTDPNRNSNNKGFMALHFEQDYDQCEWGVFLHEVHDNEIGKSYEGHTFKYLTER